MKIPVGLTSGKSGTAIFRLPTFRPLLYQFWGLETIGTFVENINEGTHTFKNLRNYIHRTMTVYFRFNEMRIQNCVSKYGGRKLLLMNRFLSNYENEYFWNRWITKGLSNLKNHRQTKMSVHKAIVLKLHIWDLSRSVITKPASKYHNLKCQIQSVVFFFVERFFWNITKRSSKFENSKWSKQDRQLLLFIYLLI